jgi:hypothetical protein
MFAHRKIGKTRVLGASAVAVAAVLAVSPAAHGTTRAPYERVLARR